MVAKILLLVGALMISTQAWGWRLLYDPPSVVIGKTTLYYNHSGAPEWLTWLAAVGAINNAISKWELECGVDLSFDSPRGLPIDTDDGLFVIGWGPTEGVAAYVVGSHEFLPGPFWEIVDADAVFNPTMITNILMFKRLLLHEIGHMIGINHSDFDGNLMSGPPFSAYNTVSSLQADDIAACQYLYGEE